ncbi:stalk domain-containing protein [Clostridiaceae bacterium 35-E11]
MKKKILAFTLCFVFVFATIVGFGVGYSQKITAWFYDIKVNIDGASIGFYRQPFIYEGQVYVSLNDLANNLGFTIQWDNENKTMNLSSNNNRFTVNTLQQQLDQKNLEIANLKFQLSQKEVELDILRDDDHTSSSSYDDLRDVEKRLEDRYEDHRNDGRTMDFDDYRLSELSNGDIQVKMYGDFDRTSSSWRYRDESDFEDFIEEICEEIDRDFNEDIEVIVYDKDNDRLAEYTYDYSRSRLTEDYTYGSTSSSSDDALEDLEELLDDEYNRHRNHSRYLDFRYQLSQKSNDDVEVIMDADFNRTDDAWQDRDKSDFRDFILDICKEVDKKFDEDVKVIVYDEDHTRIAEYTYDESKGTIDGTYDYEY